eukprot:TRINITY_DN2859_c0_g1_i2.p1 TRINITY_DN2859_c0_g1~~TRINITY_DN2859_c0_g1_i2.p1  ORF type:complete len:193 (-),score=38.98 TRINITY_DN2859_c0_g1_i2:99-677(-)
MSSRYQLIEDDDEPYEPVQTHPAQNQPAQSAQRPDAPSHGQPPASGGNHVMVVVPDNWQHGQQLQIPTPNGTHVVDVPPGLGPGQQFRVSVPDSAQSKLSVTVPEGMVPGDVITVRAPNGQLFKAPIPAGYGPGNTFYMAVPSSATQAQGGHGQQHHQQHHQQQPSMAQDPTQMNEHAKDCLLYTSPSPRDS